LWWIRRAIIFVEKYENIGKLLTAKRTPMSSIGHLWHFKSQQEKTQFSFAWTWTCVNGPIVKCSFQSNNSIAEIFTFYNTLAGSMTLRVWVVPQTKPLKIFRSCRRPNFRDWKTVLPIYDISIYISIFQFMPIRFIMVDL
jgi:hypothetical protein